MSVRKTLLATALSVAGLAMGASGAQATSCHDLVAGNTYVCTVAREDPPPFDIAIGFDAAGESATIDGVPLLCTCSSTGSSIPRLSLEAGRQIMCTSLDLGGISLAFTARATTKTLNEATIANISGTSLVAPGLMKCALLN